MLFVVIIAMLMISGLAVVIVTPIMVVVQIVRAVKQNKLAKGVK